MKCLNRRGEHTRIAVDAERGSGDSILAFCRTQGIPRAGRSIGRNVWRKAVPTSGIQIEV